MPRMVSKMVAKKSTGILHRRNPLRGTAPRRQQWPPSVQQANQPLQQQREQSIEQKRTPAVIPKLISVSVDYRTLVQIDAKDGPLYERVLSIPAVWQSMGKYLNFSDLKACRLVSTKLNRLVMDKTDFIDRAIVNVKPNVLNTMEFGRTKEAWKNMKISINRTCGYQSCKSKFHDSDWLFPLLTEVEELILEPGASCFRLCLESFGPSPTSVLLYSPKLVKLTVHPSLVRQEIFSKCNAQLLKLTHFKVSSQSPEGYCSNELVGLQKLYRCVKNLKVFESSVYFGLAPTFHSNILSIARILLKNHATLTTFKYCGPHLWESEEFSGKFRPLKLPALRIFHVTISAYNKEDVKEFLKTQSPLEEIELDLKSTKTSIPFPRDLLQIISTFHGSRLKALRIDALDFSSIFPWDWRFLTRAPLQELSLWPLDEDSLYSMAPIKHEECMVDIFQYLPPTIRKIQLHGSNSERIQNIRIQNLLRIHPTSLTHLCLSRVYGALTELNLKYIFRNFKMLRVLHLANLDDSITDFAFIAKDSSTKLAASCITNLKGLRSLTLRKCGKITDCTLTEGIKFKELQYLDLSFNPQVTIVGCVAVARQNPSLECFVNDHTKGFPSEEARRMNFPRLTCLKNWTHDADIVYTG